MEESVLFYRLIGVFGDYAGERGDIGQGWACKGCDGPGDRDWVRGYVGGPGEALMEHDRPADDHGCLLTIGQAGWAKIKMYN